MAFKFESLKVWQHALDLSESIDKLVKTFPKVEIYVLAQQIKRASDSVCLNIAEGSTGQTNKEFKRFLGYSIRSAIEVVACLHVGKRRNIIKEEDFTTIYNHIELLVKMLQSLRKSIN
ncbi:MAG: four helix bundle protein [Bacteroidales bacterium]